jgi:uncharacterized protein involved in exopolysaccharide biosynthesis
MPPTTESELREVLNAISALSQRVEIGFAQMDTKLAETKAELKGEIQRVEAKMDAQFTEVKGDIKALDQRVVALDDKVTGLDDRVKALDGRFWAFAIMLFGGVGSLALILITRYVLPAIPIK